MGKDGNALTIDTTIKYFIRIDKKCFILTYAKFTITRPSRGPGSEFGLSIRLNPTLIVVFGDPRLVVLTGGHCIRFVISGILSCCKVSHVS